MLHDIDNAQMKQDRVDMHFDTKQPNDYNPQDDVSHLYTTSNQDVDQTTNTIVVKDDYDNVICTIEMVGLVREGQMIVYYQSGQIQSISTYKKDKLNGEYKSFYESGIAQTVANYKDDKLDGQSIDYDSFGDTMRKAQYCSGYLHGPVTIYYPKSSGGRVCRVEYYENGLLSNDLVEYYPTGEVLSVTPYRNGRPQQYTKYYDKNGRIMKNLE